MNAAGINPVLVLAAGKGTRIGQPKALMIVGGRPWWRIQLERLRAANQHSLWVVSDTVAAALQRDEHAPPCVIASSEAPMFDSILAGIRAVASQSPQGVFILPVDVPAPSREVFHALRERGEAAIPSFRSTHGHPLWLRWSLATEIHQREEANSIPEGRRRLDEIVHDRATAIEVSDRSVIVNLNGPDDVQAWAMALDR